MSVEATVPEAQGYPLRYDVEYPEELSRWLIFVKWLLVIPHLIIVLVLSIPVWMATFIAFWAILFVGKYPRGLFDFVVNVNRWGANMGAYGYLLLRDEYPPFTGGSGKYPVTFDIDYPDRLNQLLPLVKWLLIIPNWLVMYVLSLAAAVIVFFSWFAILLTGKYPRGLFNFVVGVQRWNYRVNAYTNLLRDEYPPFSLR